MATHSNILAWEIPQTKVLSGLQSMGSQKSQTQLSNQTTATKTFSLCCCGNWIRRASLEAQTVKNLPAMQETQVQSLGGEGPLEKILDPHSSILAWIIPWTEEPGGL